MAKEKQTVRFVALVVAYGAAFGLASLATHTGAAGQAAACAIMAAFTAAAVAVVRRRGAGSLCGLSPMTKRNLKAALPYAVLLALPACNLAFGDGWQRITPFGATMMLCAPFLEELCFRGYLLGALATRWEKPAAAIAATALLFAALHAANAAGASAAFTAAQVATALFAGVSLGFLRLDSHSILPGAAIHFLVNVTASPAMGYSVKGLLAVSCCSAATALWSWLWWRRRAR